MQLFLDCDGVLADFNTRALEVTGRCTRDFIDKADENAFWNKIYSAQDFFYSIDLMPDAYELYHAVEHLNPIILTGKPYRSTATEQKLRWRDRYFPNLKKIFCQAKDKITFAKPGDILVDDWEMYRQTWIDGGGVWVTHTSAKDSIMQLKQLGVL